MTELLLHDAITGARARILPQLGFNCCSFQAAVAGQLLEVFDSLPGFEQGTQRPVSSGHPILFPFPNRIRNGHYQWGGKEYQLPQNDAFGNFIHGFVCDRPWRVTLAGANTAVGEFQLSVDAPDRLDWWPSDFLLEVRYSLRATCLRIDFRIVNAGDAPLPWGLGTHPYFKAPLTAMSRMSDCLVQVPAAETWELESTLVPSGRRLPVDERVDLRDGAALDGRKLDDVLTGVTAIKGRVETVVMDPAAGLQITQLCDAAFREFVVFTPPNRNSVCIEPYTCVTDAINLQGRGTDAGWRVLGVGDEFRTWVEIHVGPILA